MNITIVFTFDDKRIH